MRGWLGGTDAGRVPEGVLGAVGGNAGPAGEGSTCTIGVRGADGMVDGRRGGSFGGGPLSTALTTSRGKGVCRTSALAATSSGVTTGAVAAGGGAASLATMGARGPSAASICSSSSPARREMKQALVLLLHHPAHDSRQIVSLQVLRIIHTDAFQDPSAVAEQMRRDVRPLDAGVLGLYVENAPPMSHVVVETEQGRRSLRHRMPRPRLYSVPRRKRRRLSTHLSRKQASTAQSVSARPRPSAACLPRGAPRGSR